MRLHVPSLAASPILDQAIVSICNFLLTVSLATMLSLQGFGEFTFMIFIFLCLQGIVNAATTQPMFTLVAQQRDPVSFFAAAAILNQLLGLGTAFFIVLLVYVSAELGLSFAQNLSPLLCGVVYLLVLFQDCLRRIFFAKSRPQEALVADLIRYVLPIPSSALLFHLGELSTNGTLLLIGVSSLLSCGYSLKQLRWHPKTISYRNANVAFADLAKTGVGLAGASSFSLMRDNLYFLVSGAALPASDLGGWRAMAGAAGLMNPVLLSLENSLPRQLSIELALAGVNSMKSILLQHLSRFGTLLLAMAVTQFVLADLICRTLFPKFGSSFVFIYQLYLVIFVLQYASYVATVVLRCFGEVGSIFKTSMGSCAVSAASCYPVIYTWGLKGAVLGTLLLQVLTLSALAYAVSQTLKKSRGVSVAVEKNR